MTPKTIYQIKVTLNDSKPPIWRRLLVADTITLTKLHDILQIAMGWENYHLHMFMIGEQIYGDPEDDETGDLGTKDEKRYRLNQIVSREGFKFRYEYDFGDSWDHTLLVEKIRPAEKGVRYPVCIAGKRACPPEDVGGVWGYAEMLESLSDPESERHNEYIEWLGEDFYPEEFDLEGVNEALHSSKSRAEDEPESPPMSDAQKHSFEKLIAWVDGLSSKQLNQFDSLPVRRNMLAFITYLLEHRTVGTQSTGNLPLKAVRAICERFVNPPVLDETIGDHTYRVRSEDDVYPLFYIHTLANAGGLVTGGPARIWKVTEDGEKYLQIPSAIGIAFLLTHWWFLVDWTINFPFEGFSQGLPAEFNMKALACLLDLPVGKMFSYGTFADNLIKQSGLIWPIENEVSAWTILHSAIEHMVIDPLVTFGAMETKYGTKMIGGEGFRELTAIRLTTVGKGMLELLK
jgi:Plasmid pRiA4b ORF-3-like protein